MSDDEEFEAGGVTPLEIGPRVLEKRLAIRLHSLADNLERGSVRLVSQDESMCFGGCLLIEWRYRVIVGPDDGEPEPWENA